jgi:CheY-like chemotaxis protein
MKTEKTDRSLFPADGMSPEIKSWLSESTSDKKVEVACAEAAYIGKYSCCDPSGRRHVTMEKSGKMTAAKPIVFADNDALLLELIGELLRNRGYEVHLARDGLEALRAIRKLRPSYVILDIVMPKIDGSRVCWLIRQDSQLRETPVIALSALGPQDIRRFPELSADAYVAKGPLAVMGNNLLLAIRYLEESGPGHFEGGIFGYEGFRPRKLISEMLLLKRHWETLMRSLDRGVLELDKDGRILMANPRASEILGRKEARLIAESLPSLFPNRDQRVVQQLLDELRTAPLRDECQIVVSLNDLEVALRFSMVVEEGECAAMLVTLDARGPEAAVRR